MALTVQELISPELLGAARRIFSSVEGPIPVYLQESPGDARIGGGSAGPQTIQTLAIDSRIKTWMVAAVERLDALLDLDFAFSPTSNGSKINVYLDTVISLGGGGTTLGIALSNEFRRSSWWEVILNGPPLLANESYFKFAFVHELGHVLGLEHPFDGSDGDLGGERFGDPDANATAMSYTRPSTGWPDFYSAADLAALVSIWRLEQNTPNWLIRDANGAELLFEREQAENRLSLLLAGDALLGPAPSPPAAPTLRPASDPQLLVLSGVADRAHWDVSWDGGRSWQTGSGDTLALANAVPKQVNLRQRDPWGRLSPEFVGLVSPNQVLAVRPELLLPPPDEAQGLLPLLTGGSGDPVLLWGMTADLAADPDLASAIREAVADVDALVALDLKEISLTADASPAALLQLLFSRASAGSDDAGKALIELHRDQALIHLDDATFRLRDTLQVSLQTRAVANPVAVHRAALEGLGYALGLQAPPTGLLPETSVMVPMESSAPASETAKLSALDRSAFISLHGIEQNGADHTDLANLNTSPALLRFGNLAVSFRTEGSGRDITVLELPVQRSGNMNWSVPLGWRAGELEKGLLLEPGQREGLLRLELVSGQHQQIELQALLPMQATLEEGSDSTLELNLHALEFGLTTAELLNQSWSKESQPWENHSIAWTLAPEMNKSWGSRLRTILQAVDDACGLNFVEVEGDDPRVHWRFVSGLSAERSLQSSSTRENLFRLASNPNATATQANGSEEQQLLQAILTKLGLERPEESNDGDAYRRTPVFPDESALFNAVHSTSSRQAILQHLDMMALADLHGPDEPQRSEDDSSPPRLSLTLIREESGIQLRGEGVQTVLRLAVRRHGNLSGNNEVLLSEEHLGLRQVLTLQPGEERVELTVPVPSGTTEALSFNLEIQSGDHDPAVSSLQLFSNSAELQALATQPARDPVTDWSPDLDGDGSLTPELEGKILARFAFGTFPGDHLLADLVWPSQPSEARLQVDHWLSLGLQSGLAAGDTAQTMQLLHFGGS